MLDTLTTIASFLIALGVLVFVHELGHFLVAKWAGIRVERFSLGYPPKMIGFTRGETEYCISWIPFGGYVKVAGMADVGTEETTGAHWEFPSRSVGIRMAVIAAGPAMNFLFAFAALIFLFSVYGIDSFDSTRVNPSREFPRCRGRSGARRPRAHRRRHARRQCLRVGQCFGRDLKQRC